MKMYIAIFDFDDTLFTKTGDDDYTGLAESINNMIGIVEKYCNKIYIVTNAEKKWVEYCITNYLPDCQYILNDIDIVSSINNELCQEVDYCCLKKTLFEKILAKHFEEDGGTLFSFGDCYYDRYAALSMKSDTVRVKNVKFIENPTLEQLICEQKLIVKTFEGMFNHQGHIDTLLTVTYIESSSESQ